MFILTYGKDSYRSWQRLKQIIENFQRKTKIGTFNLLDAETLIFDDFKEDLRHKSMFEKQRLVVLRNAFSSPEFKNRFLKEAKSFFDDKNFLVVFFEDKEVSSDLLNFFKKYGRIYRHDPLSSADLKDWIKKETAQFKKTIEPSALALLIDFVGTDLWRMSAEIKKLVAYKGKDKIIEKREVELLVAPGVETAIFKTIDAIAAQDKKTALALLYKHLEKGDSPLYLLSMIIYQFRNLLLVKDLGHKPLSEITANLSLHPFVVKKSAWLASKFTLEQLQDIYLKLFRVDLAVKTGKIKPGLALELLIAGL